MKKLGLLVTVLFLLLGCGSENGNSTPKSDGKGNIDIVEYLPSKDMTKYFSFSLYGGLLYGSSGFQNIAINENEINIEQHAQAGGRFYTGIVVHNKMMTYNDFNISGFFEGYITRLVGAISYRYIDIGELLSVDRKLTTSTVNDVNNEIANIGTSTIDKSHECFYKGITHMIKDKNDNFFKESGDFLVVECNELRKETYAIDKEYRDISQKHEKSDYKVTKYLAYYEKGIGRIYEMTVEKNTMEACKIKRV